MGAPNENRPGRVPQSAAEQSAVFSAVQTGQEPLQLEDLKLFWGPEIFRLKYLEHLIATRRISDVPGDKDTKYTGTLESVVGDSPHQNLTQAESAKEQLQSWHPSYIKPGRSITRSITEAQGNAWELENQGRMAEAREVRRADREYRIGLLNERSQELDRELWSRQMPPMRAKSGVVSEVARRNRQTTPSHDFYKRLPGF